MHPRNIYNTLPNFKELAIEYPDFREYTKIDLSGKAHFDFRNPQALAALTKTLLSKDFNLNVEVPHDKLVPTLPLRLNYLLWIEDLLTSAKLTVQVKGIDIGTGACCIYPLLATKRGWRMLATEINLGSLEVAKRNVENNNLSEFITLIHVADKELILQGILKENENYFFCMCNPPFFSVNEPSKNRTNYRNPPKSVGTGISEEVETEGGEIAFVKRLIKDSMTLRDKIKIYTTLVGKLCNLQVLKKELLDLNVKNIATTVFEQGKTMRWGLAWSYSVELPTSLSKKKKNKPKPPVCYNLPEGTSLEDAVARIKEIMTGLKVPFEVEKSDPFTCNVSAFEDTWSNQRRIRRAKLLTSPEAKRLKLEKHPELRNINGNESEEETKETGIAAAVSKLSNGVEKRGLEAELLEVNNETSSESTAKREPILEFILRIQKAEEKVSVEASWLAGCTGKEGLHQILQYFKNNWHSKK